MSPVGGVTSAICASRRICRSWQQALHQADQNAHQFNSELTLFESNWLILSKFKSELTCQLHQRHLHVNDDAGAVNSSFRLLTPAQQQRARTSGRSMRCWISSTRHASRAMRAQRVGPRAFAQHHQQYALLLLVHPQKQDSLRTSSSNAVFPHGITSGSRSFSVSKEAAVATTTTATPSTTAESEARELQDAETRVVNQGASVAQWREGVCGLVMWCSNLLELVFDFCAALVNCRSGSNQDHAPGDVCELEHGTHKGTERARACMSFELHTPLTISTMGGFTLWL